MKKDFQKNSVAPHEAVLRLSRLKPNNGSRSALSGHPFDSLLLATSSLYRKSRQLYREQAGTFSPSLLSSARSLSSSDLLKNHISYSPTEDELIWAAKHEPASVLKLRTLTTSVFHEQSHRILWKHFQEAQVHAPREKNALRRYLNFVESLVVLMDMALADQVNPNTATALYLVGSIYDPGTRVRSELGNSRAARRQYRNYLHAAAYATYLNLEFYRPSQIARAIHALYPSLGPLEERVCARALRLDRNFVTRTNPIWQHRNHRPIVKALCKSANPGLILPEDPLQNVQHYLIAESWMQRFGL